MNREVMNAAAARYVRRDPERRKVQALRSHFKRAYGLTLEKRAALLQAQDGKCAICETLFSHTDKTRVDHIHGSNPVIVRGILCHGCNSGLGMFGDSVERLRSAIKYLEKFKTC